MNIFLETYGCQMNVADSELVASILSRDGLFVVDNIDQADVIIFNTCSVRQHAENRVIGRINQELSRKRQNPKLLIGVIGCMAQRLGKEISQIIPAVDFVVGTDQYEFLPEIINKTLETHVFSYKTVSDNSQVYNELHPIHQGKFNAFVTIMRGCNNFCSYCIVPYTRGRERSRPVADIISEITRAGDKGFKDITLLGQNVNSYRNAEVNFAELLRRVNNIENISRIRFITSHPKDLSDEVIEVMAESDKVCEHLHLALQSGDDDILRRMNRGYTADHFRMIVGKLRKNIPDISITTDVIAGFPGENQAQFERTRQIMQELEFDYAFTYKYSPREGTVAATFPDQVSETERLVRLKELIKIQEKITLKKYQQQIGKIKEIYVENFSRKNKSEVSGKSRDYKITVFPGGEEAIGRFIRVRITDATGWTLRGESL
ncbi:MAG: tRNA (N6-isopentenyl adenosine(37)-C2)-methylthiotransferase MiaB [Candidatus Cloacimonetes bacterium]|nr:tRNA (N6-isopentenyl adenosine(37)-C2)-methylthiotransferase MiaB [Candidatus Cloacimonadota bacterium]